MVTHGRASLLALPHITRKLTTGDACPCPHTSKRDDNSQGRPLGMEKKFSTLGKTVQFPIMHLILQPPIGARLPKRQLDWESGAHNNGLDKSFSFGVVPIPGKDA